MRASGLASLVLLLAVGCVSTNEPTTDDRRTLRAVTLPDLSRLEESVQAQLRERYVALTAKHKDPGTPVAVLGREYGDMGTLLLAAEFHDPAEAALLNAHALATDEMRWPYYLGHLYWTKGDIPKALAAFERALRVAPSDVPTARVAPYAVATASRSPARSSNRYPVGGALDRP